MILFCLKKKRQKKTKERKHFVNTESKIDIEREKKKNKSSGKHYAENYQQKKKKKKTKPETVARLDSQSMNLETKCIETEQSVRLTQLHYKQSRVLLSVFLFLQ